MIRIYPWLFLYICIITISVNAQPSCNKPGYKEGRNNLNKAELLTGQDQFQQAYPYYIKALHALVNSSCYNELALIYTGIGRYHIKMGEYDTAMVYLGKASKIAYDKCIKNANIIADIWYTKGIAYNYLSEAEKSIQSHQKALKIRLAANPPDPVELAWSYMSIGDVYRWLKYDFYESEKYYEKALKNFSAADRKNNLNLLFRLYYNLASIYRNKGDYEKALTYAYYDHEILNELKTKDEQMELFVYQLIANIYSQNEDYTEALPIFQKMLTLLQNDPKSNQHFDMSNFYSNMGYAYLYTNQLDSAEYWIRKSMKPYHNFGRQDSINISYSYYHLGIIYNKREQNRKSLVYLNTALSIRKKVFGLKNGEVADAYNNIAKVYISMHLYDSSLVFYHKALISGIPDFNNEDVYSLPPATSSVYEYSALNILAAKAELLLDHFTQNQKCMQLAYTIYKQLDNIIMSRRIIPDWEKSKLEFAGNIRKIYKNAVRCSLQLYSQTNNDLYYWQAYAFMENSKSQILYDNIRKRKLFEQGVPDSLTDKLYYYQAQIGSLRDKLNTAILTEESDNRNPNAIRAEIIDMEKARERLEKWIIQKYLNRNYDFLFNNSPDYNDFDRWAKRTQSLVINYFLEEDLFYVFWYDGQKHGYQQIHNFSNLSGDISVIRNILDNPDVLSKEQYLKFIGISFDLYTLLIKPLNPIICKQLIIVPDGSLFYLPFEILLSSKGNPHTIDYRNLKYLLHNQNISYAYSNSLLLKSLSMKNKPKEKEVIGYSFSENSGYDKVAKRSLKTNIYGSDDLPGTAIEINAIKNYLPGNFYFGSAASEHHFKNYAPDYNIIHLAIHGSTDYENEFNSSLHFNKDSDSYEDGLLHIYEMYEIQLSSNLMVLSACESGIGKNYKGEGVYSMARGVFLAGCPSVVMSLWKIKDMTTASIMKRFYYYISKGIPVNTALTLSKRDYIRNTDEYSAHPAYWGGFVYVGNTKPVATNSFKKLIIVTITLVSIMIILMIVAKSRVIKQKHSYSK